MTQYVIRSQTTHEYFTGVRSTDCFLTVCDDLLKAMVFNSVGEALVAYARWHKDAHRDQNWSSVPELVTVREATRRILGDVVA
jgi:hypothetical protein